MDLPPEILEMLQGDPKESPSYKCFVGIADLIMESALEYGKREGFLLKEFEISDNLREKIQNLIMANIHDEAAFKTLNKAAIQMFMGYNQCLLDQQGKKNVV